MLHSRRQHQKIPDTQRICLSERLEDDLALENVNAHRTVGVVRGQITARSEGKDREPQGSFLDERPRTASVTGHEGLIDRLLVSREVTDEHFAGDSAVE
jgi:hypothetical protein